MALTDVGTKQVAQQFLAAAGYLGSARLLLEDAADTRWTRIEQVREELYQLAKQLDPTIP